MPLLQSAQGPRRPGTAGAGPAWPPVTCAFAPPASASPCSPSTTPSPSWAWSSSAACCTPTAASESAAAPPRPAACASASAGTALARPPGPCQATAPAGLGWFCVAVGAQGARRRRGALDGVNSGEGIGASPPGPSRAQELCCLQLPFPRPQWLESLPSRSGQGPRGSLLGWDRWTHGRKTARLKMEWEGDR